MERRSPTNISSLILLESHENKITRYLSTYSTAWYVLSFHSKLIIRNPTVPYLISLCFRYENICLSTKRKIRIDDKVAIYSLHQTTHKEPFNML